MMSSRYRVLLTPLGLSLMALFVAGCLTQFSMEQDPFFESFYEKASLIMTEEEQEIYKRLPDEKSKEEFIQEFWEIRDPDPGTVENENKTAFEERIEYANLWFGRWNPSRGRESRGKPQELRGWNSDRGRVYIILGEPDELYFDGVPIVGGRRISQPQAQRHEQWYYYRHQLSVIFVKNSSGRWDLANPGSELFSALESAKLNLVDPGFQEDIARRLRFDAAFKDNVIHVSIPVQRIYFDERGEKLHAEFKIKINVFLDNVKIETIEDVQAFDRSEIEILEQEELKLAIPYEPKVSGRYLFDIIIEDAMAFVFSKYRDVVRYTRKDRRSEVPI